ncbi:MAG: hypothetical protein ACR2IE_00910 [Candidatus Sumerlaeaceae bacterium]
MDVRRVVSFAAPLLWFAVILQGCAAKKGLNNVGLAASQSPSTSVQPPVAAAERPPYALSAQCNGPMVQFRLQNLGNTDLQIENKDFALVVPGKSRKVIPYSKQTVSVDLPTRVVGPNETVQGRAVFNDNIMPTGCRLVFKPYSRPQDGGTFAEIGSRPATL